MDARERHQSRLPQNTQVSFPSLEEIVALAGLGDLQGVAKQLALRRDARNTRKHMQAVGSISEKTRNPKASVAEAEWAGQALAGIIPEDSDQVIQMIWELAKIEWERRQNPTIPKKS